VQDRESSLFRPTPFKLNFSALMIGRRSKGIHYSAYTQHVHQRMVRMLFHSMCLRLEEERNEEWPGASITDFVIIFGGSCGGDITEAFATVPWDEWDSEHMTGDCVPAESELSRTIERWKATREPTTRLVEAIFQYNQETHISLLMEIALSVDSGPILRSVVRVG
jgi:hypothetical protein